MMRTHIVLCFAALGAMTLVGAPAERFKSDAPASDWRHAMLVGNGTIGAMIEGNVSDELMHLSHAKLFLPQAYDGLIVPAIGQRNLAPP